MQAPATLAPSPREQEVMRARQTEQVRVCNDTSLPLSETAEWSLRQQLERVTAERDAALQLVAQMLAHGVETLDAVEKLLGEGA